jgi:hypothetical protein
MEHPMIPHVEQLESRDCPTTFLIPAGTYQTGLNAIVGPLQSGTPAEYTVYQAAGRVVLQPQGFQERGIYVTDASYLEFRGFTIQGGYDGVKIESWVSNIRLVDMEISGAQNQGILNGAPYCEFIRLYVHDNGTTFGLDHGLYQAGDYGRIVGGWYSGNVGAGIQIYRSGPNGGPGQPIGNVIDRPRVWGNQWAAVVDWGQDTLIVGQVPYHSLGYGGKPPRWVDFWRHANWRGPELLTVPTPRPIPRPVRSW